MITKYIRRDDKFDFSQPFTSPKQLPSGVYTVGQNEDGSAYLKASHIETENLVRLQDSAMAEIYDHVNNFLSAKIRKGFEKYGLLYKRGILLYGPPGTGKTSLVNQLISLCASEKEMVILNNPHPGLVKPIVDCVRGIEQDDRPFMVVWEEFENWVENNEGDLLNLLDGIDQVGNTLYIATTNYIDQIPDRIKNRPSRFADVMEIGLPSAAARRTFLEAKIHKTDNVDLDMWVAHSEGLSIDHLKDLIISVLVIGIPFEKALAKARSISNEEYQQEEDTPNTPLSSRLRKASRVMAAQHYAPAVASVNQAIAVDSAECAKSG